MNVLIQGIGGIGGITAAQLVSAGVRVTPVTGNPVIAEALNRYGFRLEEPQGLRSIPLNMPATPTVPTDGGPYDLIILATPATALETALLASRDQLSPDGVVVCFQNGLPEDRAAELIDRAQVLGCVVGWGASMVAPGHYRKTSSGGFQLGRPDGAQDAALPHIEQLLGYVAPTRVTSNLAGVRWSKLAINSAITTMGAIGGDRLGALMRHRFVRRLALEIFTEVVAVAQASRIRLEKVNGTFDLEKIALREEERLYTMGSPSLLWKHSILMAIGMKYRGLRSSMLYALERGRTPEIEHLNGEVVRRGDVLKVPAPVNRRLVRTIEEIALGTRTSSLETLRQVFEDRPMA